MKRRDLIKTASVIAAAPFLSSWTNEFSGFEQSVKEPLPNQVSRFGDGRDWFFERRYGMFVHWGIYSIPGWHEQHQWRAREDRSKYVKLAGHWNPKKFNPEQWLDLMEEAGMKYITITTKHHDGFCLWDTKQTTFNT